MEVGYICNGASRGWGYRIAPEVRALIERAGLDVADYVGIRYDSRALASDACELAKAQLIVDLRKGGN